MGDQDVDGVRPPRRAWVVAKQLPARTDSGGRQRIRAVIDTYAEVFADVQVVGFDAWDDWREQLPAHVVVHPVEAPQATAPAVLRSSVFAGKWYSGRLRALLAQQVRGRDVVHVDFPQMAVNVPADVRIDVLDMHNVESDLIDRRLRTEHPRARWLVRPEVARFRRFERAVVRRAVRVTACSRRDQEELAAAGVQSLFVPNGVTEPAGRSPQPGTASALFVGAVDYGPNRAGLRWFLDEVWPAVLARTPQARFTAVGRALSDVHPREAGEPAGVAFHSQVPSVDPFYDAADVCVVPLLSGGGTKIKLVEAMSRGRAVVTTSVGLEGLEEYRSAVVVADDPTSFADAVARLLRDPAEAQRLGKVAAEAIAEDFSWRTAMTPLRDLLIGLRDN
ncbi:glycosyltransferase family 4 protein [Kineococcus glutinatus]|uniref:Glycosyltransferase involved in cell wall biosynthesis n=1 Tax=Kineococcus glutinatus TaxID=1070872 RepID=A0ABP9HWH1_9ACTN